MEEDDIIARFAAVGRGGPVIPDTAIVRIVIEDGFTDAIQEPRPPQMLAGRGWRRAAAPDHSFVFPLVNCYHLQELRLPNTPFSLGRRALMNCFSLRTIHWPRGARHVGFEAFRNCMWLPEITIPRGVTRIEDAAFGECSSLRRFIVPDTVEHIAICFTAGMSLVHVDIPDSISVASVEAFTFSYDAPIRFNIRPVLNRRSDELRVRAAHQLLYNDRRLGGLMDSGGGRHGGIHPLSLALNTFLMTGPASVIGVMAALAVIHRARARWNAERRDAGAGAAAAAAQY